MTWGGKLAALFPALHLGLILTFVVRSFLEPTTINFLGTVFFIYLFPVLVFRLHNIFFPLIEGITDISKPIYNPWWTSHQLQLLFVAIPVFEGFLHMVPGVFSIWLRLWGSKIGKGVYWTPKIEIVDRGLLQIGNRVVIGHMTAFCSHAISPIEGRLSLIVRNIQIGEGAFVGAEVRLGPGASVGPSEMVKYRTLRYWKAE